MSRIRDIVRRQDNSEGPALGAPEPIVAAGAPLPWLESAPDDFDDDNVDDEPLIPRKWLLIGGLLFLTLLAGVLFAIYKRAGGKEASGPAVVTSASVDDPRIPLIEAPSTPVRSKPDDPGGMQMADTDKQVYDVADGQVIDEPTQMAQAAEQPVERPVAPLPADTPIPDVAPVNPPKDILPPAPIARPAEVVKKPEAVKKPVEAPRPKPVPPKPVEKPVIAAAPVIETGGNVYVQLGAFSSRERAEAAWAGLSGKSGLAGLSSDIQEAGPTKFRLRAGPVLSRAAGETVCAKVKAAGQACLIAK